MFSSTLISFLLITSTALATPSPHRSASAPKFKTRCNVSRAVVDVPANQTVLPTSTLPTTFLALGVGTQNYTCSSSGTYTNVGAYAQVFDISCLYGRPAFDNVQDVAIAAWSKAPPTLTTFNLTSIPPLASCDLLGEHYFITNPITGSGLSPIWDFTAHAFKGNPNAFVVGAKNASLNAPTGPQDIAWLQLTAVKGSLASEIYRTDTRLGQPPASCTPGSADITVKYTAKYWLLGGSL